MLENNVIYEASIVMGTFCKIIVYGAIISHSVFIILNIITTKVILYAMKQNVLNRSKRPNLLKLNIVYSNIIISFGYCICFNIVQNVVGNYSIQSIIMPITGSLVNYTNSLSLYVNSISITVLSCDQYFSLTQVFSTNNPLNRLSTKWLLYCICIITAIFRNKSDILPGL